MPFIRYANGDIATAGPTRRCACGRALPRIESVQGRISETLRDGNGAAVSGIALIVRVPGRRERDPPVPGGPAQGPLGHDQHRAGRTSCRAAALDEIRATGEQLLAGIDVARQGRAGAAAQRGRQAPPRRRRALSYHRGVRSLLVARRLGRHARPQPPRRSTSPTTPTHLDLDKHVLQFKPSRAIAEAALVAIGEDGSELGKGAATYKDASTGWLAITWTQPANTRVMMLKLRVAAADGVATNVELVPWSVEVAHEDVNFATDSAVIEPSESAKLDASLAKIKDVDREGREVHEDAALRRRPHRHRRADGEEPQALARARDRDRRSTSGSKGSTIPIAFAGFGEDVLKVKTADNTDERANRRADYVLGPAAGPPPFGGAYLKAKATWKQLRSAPLRVDHDVLRAARLAREDQALRAVRGRQRVLLPPSRPCRRPAASCTGRRCRSGTRTGSRRRTPRRPRAR